MKSIKDIEAIIKQQEWKTEGFDKDKYIEELLGELRLKAIQLEAVLYTSDITEKANGQLGRMYNEKCRELENLKKFSAETIRPVVMDETMDAMIVRTSGLHPSFEPFYQRRVQLTEEEAKYILEVQSEQMGEPGMVCIGLEPVRRAPCDLGVICLQDFVKKDEKK